MLHKRNIICLVLFSLLVFITEFLFLRQFGKPVIHYVHEKITSNTSKHEDEKITSNTSNRRNQTGFTWLNNHPIFSKFKISPPPLRKRVTVLIIISTAPQRFDRRQGIRETWWKQCVKTNSVIPECFFMTDRQEPSSKHYQRIQNESLQHGDMRFQDLRGGVELGARFMLHAVFALQYYDFDYFIRMDDDLFFCLNNFLQELPQPMIPQFHWGWVHCIKGITRPEESIILFSKDLLITYMSQDPRTIKCHVMADQMVGEWTNDLNLGGIFRHDNRIHHHPKVSDVPGLRDTRNVCKHFMAIHGTYAKDMKLFWSNRGPSMNVTKNLFSNSKNCEFKTFDWRLFFEPWKFETKKCIDNPKWNTSKLFPDKGIYLGREHHW